MKTLQNPPSAREPEDIRPLVGSAGKDVGLWLFGAVAVVGATVLFAALETRRETIKAPAIGPVSGPGTAVIASSPELFIPPSFARPIGRVGSTSVELPPAPAEVAADAPPTPSGARQRRARTQPANPEPVPYPIPLYVPPQPQVVYNGGGVQPQTIGGSVDFGNQADRVRATQFVNPALTVPKGTIIVAVLETALDSTRSGFARAIVSRDVVGFDGSRVLIPKGSRLIGEYKNDLAPGQKRALIQWQRLMRPDGAIMNLDSPSADPLGRAGVRGKVNSHFFERFGGAILRSILDIGTQVALNKATDGTVVYAIPLPSQSLPIASPDKVQPTLTVRQGTSVSVFVAKDLDFSTVER